MTTNLTPLDIFALVQEQPFDPRTGFHSLPALDVDGNPCTLQIDPALNLTSSDDPEDIENGDGQDPDGTLLLPLTPEQREHYDARGADPGSTPLWMIEEDCLDDPDRASLYELAATFTIND